MNQWETSESVTGNIPESDITLESFADPVALFSFCRYHTIGFPLEQRKKEVPKYKLL